MQLKPCCINPVLSLINLTKSEQMEVLVVKVCIVLCILYVAGCTCVFSWGLVGALDLSWDTDSALNDYGYGIPSSWRVPF